VLPVSDSASCCAAAGCGMAWPVALGAAAGAPTGMAAGAAVQAASATASVTGSTAAVSSSLPQLSAALPRWPATVTAPGSLCHGGPGPAATYPAIYPPFQSRIRSKSDG
jgi:hypothetical protein